MFLHFKQTEFYAALCCWMLPWSKCLQHLHYPRAHFRENAYWTLETPQQSLKHCSQSASAGLSYCMWMWKPGNKWNSGDQMESSAGMVHWGGHRCDGPKINKSVRCKITGFHSRSSNGDMVLQYAYYERVEKNAAIATISIVDAGASFRNKRKIINSKRVQILFIHGGTGSLVSTDKWCLKQVCAVFTSCN